LFNQNVRLSKIFFTTHHDLNSFAWSNAVYKVTLKGIDEHGFNRLLEIYGDEKIDFALARRLHKVLDGHPYLLKLSTAIASYQPIETLIENLEGENIKEVSDYIKERIISSLSSKRSSS
jgi:hypothetical protein